MLSKSCIFLSYTLLLLFIIVSLPTKGLAESPPALKFLGASSCKSSSCHGGAGPLREQHDIWSRFDFHSRANATLYSARSKRLAESLDIPEPATSSRCTACHSPLQTLQPELKGPQIKVTEGISCESCHGASENWLRSHTRTDLDHEQKIALGMRDLSTPYQQANSCVGCHHNVDPEIADAGHPWLHFQLDRQLADMPAHWQHDQTDNFTNWMVGELVALRETSWHLIQDAAKSERRLDDWRSSLWLLKITDPSVDWPASGEKPSREELEDVWSIANTQARQTGSALSREASSTPSSRAISCWKRLLDSGASLQTLDRQVQPAAARKLTRALKNLAKAVWAEETSQHPDQTFLEMEQSTRYPENFDAAVFALSLEQLRTKSAEQRDPR